MSANVAKRVGMNKIFGKLRLKKSGMWLLSRSEGSLKLFKLFKVKELN